MNSFRTLTSATLIASVLAAALMAAAPTAQAVDVGVATVAHLPRVVVTGHVQRAEVAAAMRIIDLPRVVVTGRRADSRDAQWALNSELRARPGKVSAIGRLNG